MGTGWWRDELCVPDESERLVLSFLRARIMGADERRSLYEKTSVVRPMSTLSFMWSSSMAVKRSFTLMPVRVPASMMNGRPSTISIFANAVSTHISGPWDIP